MLSIAPSQYVTWVLRSVRSSCSVHAWNQFERKVSRRHGQAPSLRVTGLAERTGPKTDRLQREILEGQRMRSTLPVDERAARDRMG